MSRYGFRIGYSVLGPCQLHPTVAAPMNYLLGACFIISGYILIDVLLSRGGLVKRWVCAGCGKRVIEGHSPVAFCPQCGALRRWGDGARNPLTIASKAKVPGAVRHRVREIIGTERLEDALPLGTLSTAKIIARVANDTVVTAAHPTWTAIGVENANALPGFTRQPATAVVPPNTWLVEVECVARRTGGMSSHFGYDGVFVSVLVAVDDGRIWDVRATDAT